MIMPRTRRGSVGILFCAALSTLLGVSIADLGELPPYFDSARSIPLAELHLHLGHALMQRGEIVSAAASFGRAEALGIRPEKLEQSVAELRQSARGEM